jgi:hypothetical protein
VGAGWGRGGLSGSGAGTGGFLFARHLNLLLL